MRNLILIKLLLNYSYFRNYSQFILLDHIKANYPVFYKMLLVVYDMQQTDGRDYSVADLEIAFFNSYPALKDKDREEYDDLFKQMDAAEVSDDIGRSLLDKHREQAIATSIGFTAIDVAEGKKEFDHLLFEIDKLKAIKEEVKLETTFVTDDLDLLVAEAVKDKGLQFRLVTLRKMFGSLRKGDFGFIFARPEVGKTTLLASEITYFVDQTDRPLVWFNNEEAGAKVMLRCYQAYFKKTIPEILQNTRYYKDKFQRETEGRIKIYDNASIHRSTVEKVCEREEPGLIIFDSIDKLKGWKDDRDDLVYKEIYQWSREIAKTYCPTIGVCHASANAEGKRYLEMDDVAYAKTAKQGEADWILGLGATHNAGEETVRFLHAPKNKLIGDEESLEELRHGKTSVVIKPEYARYEDIMEW